MRVFSVSSIKLLRCQEKGTKFESVQECGIMQVNCVRFG